MKLFIRFIVRITCHMNKFRAISEPMEALLATVPGLASIHSFTRQELALIEIQLSWDASLCVRLY